jgi:alpha-galactosidase
MSNKVTVFGAGGVVFSLGLVKDLCLTKELSGSHVCFMDINEESLDVIYNLGKRYAEDFGAHLTFEKTTDRETALKGADFVANTATVTHNEYFKQRRRKITAELGYFYDRTGLPEYHNLQLMLDVAKDMEKLCPDAWMLLAGNPVFDGTTLMTRQTSTKVCGLCHGHYGYKAIARVLGLDPDKVTWQAPGLNHNIWLTDFIYENEDMYPRLDQWIAEESEAFWESRIKEGKSIPDQMSRSAIKQYKMYGLMPIGDTPRAPRDWWYHTDMEARKYWFDPGGSKDTPTGRDRVLESKAKKFEQMKQAAYDEKIRPIDLFGDKKTHEQHIPIMNGLVNNVEGQFQVNVPNNGVLPGIPHDVAVEVPAIVNKKGIQPMRVPPLPKKIMLECILPHWLTMEQGLEALISGDKSMMLYGVLKSPETRSYEHAKETLEAMFDIDPNEPMAHLEDIHAHYAWPKNW